MTFLLPGTKPSTHIRGTKEDAQYEEAKAARKRAKERHKQLSWNAAVKHMGQWPSSMAVESIRPFPQAVQEMYLLAEEVGQNRREVLEFFPAPGPKTREVWAEFATPSAPDQADIPEQRN